MATTRDISETSSILAEARWRMSIAEDFSFDEAISARPSPIGGLYWSGRGVAQTWKKLRSMRQICRDTRQAKLRFFPALRRAATLFGSHITMALNNAVGRGAGPGTGTGLAGGT